MTKMYYLLTTCRPSEGSRCPRQQSSSQQTVCFRPRNLQELGDTMAGIFPVLPVLWIKSSASQCHTPLPLHRVSQQLLADLPVPQKLPQWIKDTAQLVELRVRIDG